MLSGLAILATLSLSLKDFLFSIFLVYVTFFLQKKCHFYVLLYSVWIMVVIVLVCSPSFSPRFSAVPTHSHVWKWNRQCVSCFRVRFFFEVQASSPTSNQSKREERKRMWAGKKKRSGILRLDLCRGEVAINEFRWRRSRKRDSRGSGEMGGGGIVLSWVS